MDDLTRQQVWLQAILNSATDLSLSSPAQGLGGLLSAFDPAVFRQAGANLLKVLDDVLDLAKMESGQFRLVESDFDLRSVVGETLEMVSLKARTKHLTLKLSVTAEAPRVVVGDAKRLRQTLANCLYHAVQFSEAGELCITVSPDAFYKNHLHFEITGRGLRIPDEQVADIFCDFSDAGLDLCDKLIQRMGGELHVCNEPGKGSSIHFDLVFDSASQEEDAFTHLLDAQVEIQCDKAQAVVRTPGNTAPFRVLIAEDSEDSRFLLQEFLKKSSYAITFAENGQVAVEAARAQSFDLILMDIQMPVMDGLTATRLIRQEEQARGKAPAPLLALTANARKTDIELSRAAGCNAHLLKPISRQELLNTIQKYVPLKAEARHTQAGMEISIPEGLEEAAERYLKSRTSELPRLKQLVAANEFEQLRMLAHNMKGTGTSFGFPDLTRLGAQMECAAKAQSEADLSSQMLELSSYLEQAALMLTPELVSKR